jgi:hypothetical protein
MVNFGTSQPRGARRTLTERVFRGLRRLFDKWELEGDYQTLMLHEFDVQYGVTFPGVLD